GGGEQTHHHQARHRRSPHRVRLRAPEHAAGPLRRAGLQGSRRQELVPVDRSLPAQPHEDVQLLTEDLCSRSTHPARAGELPVNYRRSLGLLACFFTSSVCISRPLLQRIDAFGVGKVVVSGNEEFERDDVVVGLLAWEEYTVVRPGTTLTKVDPHEFPLSYHVSILERRRKWTHKIDRRRKKATRNTDHGALLFAAGPSGLTAYAGFYDICKPKKGEKVFVSTASGSVGSLVGQYAKLSGCYVVGCAGSKTKVDLLKEKLGFDDAFNYKEEPDLKSALRRYFPEGVDIYFDNVGSAMLDAAVANMNLFGRVALCGAISEYTDAGKRAALDMVDVIYKRITLRGFLALDHLNLYAGFISSTSDHLRHGRMRAVEDISTGLESVPSAFAGLFRGDNVGKKLVQLTSL
ncbi:unnamed protein product, partial [Musa hybrid cultivar]